MSVQNALKLIQKLRVESPIENIDSLEYIQNISPTYNLTCSVEELQKAFKIDWKMRWIKTHESRLKT
jgi:hypothetical protein